MSPHVQLQEIAAAHNLKVWIRDLTLKLCNLAIQGPKSRDLLRKLVFTQPAQPELDNIKWFGCTIARSHDRKRHSVYADPQRLHR